MKLVNTSLDDLDKVISIIDMPKAHLTRGVIWFDNSEKLAFDKFIQ